MSWVGKALARKEDHRLLRGRGRFTADVRRPGLLHAAFARSPLASARIGAVRAPDALAVRGVHAVLDAGTLGCADVLAALHRPEFVPTAMPVLARDRVRYAGEPFAIVLAEDAYAAEDGAELVAVDQDPIEALASMPAALAGAPLHEGLTANTFLDVFPFEDPEIERVFAGAHTVELEFRSARVAALPMEGRACLAEWDEREDQLVVTVSTQVPHQVRTAIAESLRLPERQVRVLAPDVGGGFGLKCVVGREEIAVAAAAYRTGHAVAWFEDRVENLTASFHGHEQWHRVRAAFDEQGRLLALDADIRCDVGAYSAFPFTSGVEPLMAATELPGAYRVPRYRARARGIATNKPPTAPYRGVSRPQIVAVMEGVMTEAGRQLGIDPLEVRRRNLITEFPYTGVNGITYDPGSYSESLDRCAELLASEERGPLRGIGFACFNERTGYGTEAFAARKMEFTPGYEIANARMDPSGTVTVTTGTSAHGQGHETTLAQVTADRLGL
ncbi:xanthine dehydrogenase family protein molybdopterin-binding subunit, partial [Sciscionella sediminilitoris]|uniref:xanthine dehydrogenase family protein molybdopterin-binding subunit n=1 Tax=Sciscionella sediminilitoris TaxID=1445613 RepID=UPI0005646F87